MKTTNQLTRFLAMIISIALFFLLAFAGKLFSQETTANSKWKINSIALTTGETPLSNGLNVDVFLQKGKNSIWACYNTVLGQIVYDIPITKIISVQPTGGIYHNVPWVGPMVTFKLFKSQLVTNHWFGWSAGVPEEGEASLKKITFLYSFQQVTYSPSYLKGFDFYYVIFHYEKNSAAHMLGMKKTVKLGENLAINGSFTELIQTEALLKNKLLWSLGFVWSFSN
jgi:hypothetical protein